MFENITSLVGRTLIAALFLAGAVQKTVDPGAAQALLAGWNWPESLVWLALAFNALAGLALVLGLAVRPVALSLAGYCALTAFFHLIPDDPWQMSIFVKNWAIAGGCLVLAAQGGGAWRLRFADKPLVSR
ncbi:DoxX family protein [Antarctobacter sp.]|uniref:DoxX family protein n=1 Tax=Antarctobacter sp. TaxID=1872577 RepID=UPI003A931396